MATDLNSWFVPGWEERWLNQLVAEELEEQKSLAESMPDCVDLRSQPKYESKKCISSIRPELKPTDRLSIIEWAEIFGFTPPAVLSAIERNRREVLKDYYSIPKLASRWNCSRAKVYDVLRKAEFELLDLSQPGTDKGTKGVPGHVVEHIEQSRMHLLPEKETCSSEFVLAFEQMTIDVLHHRHR